MASTGEKIGSAYELAFLEPGSVTNYYDLTTYVNQDKLTKKTGEADTTAHSTVTKTFIPGLNENTLTFDLMHNNTPAYAQRPQTRVRQLQQTRTVTTWRIRPDGDGSGFEEVTFTAFVTQMDDNYANDNKPVSSTVALRVNALTFATQT